MTVKGTQLAAMEPNIFSFCLGKEAQVSYQLFAFLSRAQHGLGGLSRSAGELEGDLGSISWLPITKVIPKSREAVV